MKNLNDWARDCHTIARNHGWWDNDRAMPELLCLVHSEVSEALEAYRNDLGYDAFSEEMADILIRVFDMCAYYNIDIEKAVTEKCIKNRDRPYRHGGKKA